jgi:hypothetical protein
MLPDLSFKNSTNGSPTALFTTGVRNYQQGTYSAVNVSTFTPSTEQFFLRLRGRQMTMRVGSEDLGTTWRLGSPRYDIRPDGRR